MANKKFMRGLQQGMIAGYKQGAQQKSDSEVEYIDEELQEVTKMVNQLKPGAGETPTREYVKARRLQLSLMQARRPDVFGDDVIRSDKEIEFEYEKAGGIEEKGEQLELAKINKPQLIQDLKSEKERKKAIATTKYETIKKTTDSMVDELDRLYKKQYIIDKAKRYLEESDDADAATGEMLTLIKSAGIDEVEFKGEFDIDVLLAKAVPGDDGAYVDEAIEARVKALTEQFKEVSGVDMPLSKRDADIDSAFTSERDNVNLLVLQKQYSDLGLDISGLLSQAGEAVTIGKETFKTEWTPLDWDADDEKVLGAYLQQHYVENKKVAVNEKLKMLEYEFKNLLEDVYYKKGE